MSRKLYVGNLSYQTEAASLQQLFEQAGTVQTVNVMKDMATGRSRGFAFVEMSTEEEAAKAISELNARQFEGRSLMVNEARPKPDHGGGFANAPRRSRNEPW
jgi:RNA recognition motif-containing protein